jgi:hypothetical protein
MGERCRIEEPIQTANHGVVLLTPRGLRTNTTLPEKAVKWILITVAESGFATRDSLRRQLTHFTAWFCFNSVIR